MFDEMQKLSDGNKITMTVYVDDVTFSNEKRISKDFRDKILAIIKKYHYQISRHKVQRYTKSYSKLVTGVIITSTGTVALNNPMHIKILIAFKELKNNPENDTVRKKLKGLLTAARQVDKNIFPAIYDFTFQPLEKNTK